MLLRCASRLLRDAAAVQRAARSLSSSPASASTSTSALSIGSVSSWASVDPYTVSQGRPLQLYNLVCGEWSLPDSGKDSSSRRRRRRRKVWCTMDVLKQFVRLDRQTRRFLE